MKATGRIEYELPVEGQLSQRAAAVADPFVDASRLVFLQARLCLAGRVSSGWLLEPAGCRGG